MRAGPGYLLLATVCASTAALGAGPVEADSSPLTEEYIGLPMPPGFRVESTELDEPVAHAPRCLLRRVAIAPTDDVLDALDDALGLCLLATDDERALVLGRRCEKALSL